MFYVVVNTIGGCVLEIRAHQGGTKGLFFQARLVSRALPDFITFSPFSSSFGSWYPTSREVSKNKKFCGKGEIFSFSKMLLCVVGELFMCIRGHP